MELANCSLEQLSVKLNIRTELQKGRTKQFVQSRLHMEGLNIVTPLEVYGKGDSIWSCVSCFAKDRKQDLNKAREFNSPWLPEKISGRRDGSMTNISPQNLVRGDIVRVREGQLVPADLRVLECSEDCTVNLSALTKQWPRPVKVQATPVQPGQTLPSAPLLSFNMAWLGSMVVSGQLLGVVTATGDDTLIAKHVFICTDRKYEDTLKTLSKFQTAPKSTVEMSEVEKELDAASS
jgi:magnesium-transporting ATPase (P-type)